MKVVHLGEFVNGGVATYIENVLDFQSNSPQISELYLILSNLNSQTNFPLDKEKIIRYDYKRNLFNMFTAIFKLKKLLNNIKPDLIHLHSSFAGLFIRLAYFFQKDRPKIVYCSHGWSFLMETSNFKKNIYAFIEGLLSRNTDLIINISNYEYTKSLDFKIPKEKSIVISNGLKEKSKSTSSLNFTVDSSKINILFVGRFDRQKGLDILLNYFDEYDHPDIKLYIIGDNILNKEKVNIPNNVINLGWINNNLIDSYYEKFDAVIIPSRWEGFGLVAIEAMRNSTAVLVSNRGALPELVTHGENGLIFDLDNISSLNSVLNSLNKPMLQLMGEKGYTRFLTDYKSDFMNDEIIKSYQHILK